MDNNNSDSIKPKRTIVWCVECTWAADMTNSAVQIVNRPFCVSKRFSGAADGPHWASFHEHEKGAVNDMLSMDEINRTVDDVKPYETT